MTKREAELLANSQVTSLEREWIQERLARWASLNEREKAQIEREIRAVLRPDQMHLPIADYLRAKGIAALKGELTPEAKASKAEGAGDTKPVVEAAGDAEPEVEAAGEGSTSDE